ncbi:MAG: hypothetical protein ABI417_15215 [Coleofasciculaceae cyanobacterium]
MNNLTNHHWSKPKAQLPKDESVAASPARLQTHSLHTPNQPSEESEAEIIERMVEYMKEFLEKPHQVFQGLPICPFARKARLDNQILYKVHRFATTPDLAEMEMIQEFCQEQRYEVLLVMHPEKQALTQLQMQEFIEKLNAKIAPTGLVAFGGHPEQDFQIQGIHTRQEPYLNFTVQFQQRLKDASDLLLRTTSYYQNWTAENLRDVGIPRESNCS